MAALLLARSVIQRRHMNRVSFAPSAKISKAPLYVEELIPVLDFDR